jgi:hypothetical protein
MAQCEEEAKTNLLLLTRVTNRIDIDSNNVADPINRHDSSRFNFIVSSFKVYYAFFILILINRNTKKTLIVLNQYQ